MEDEIEECIRKKIQWAQLPAPMRKLLSDSPKEYERLIYEFSISNQLRYRGSLVRTVRKDEKKYYETLVQNSIQRLMLYPYHLADMIVKGLRITPFIYYVEVVALLIESEKSYDTMPNFTAADCLRLLGIGRNEYLDLVAKARSLGRRGRSKAIRALLPRVPLSVPMQPWWRVELGYVLEGDVKPLSESEKAVIDMLIDRGSQTAGTVDYDVIKNLYRRGLIYLDVPITTADKVSVPPLKGFVMNRIAGDYFETLLYKVFVSIDEHTSVSDLAAVLQVDCELVKQAVSLYCRLGFANNLQPQPVVPQHPSWRDAVTTHTHQPYRQIAPLTFDPNIDDDAIQMEPVLIKQVKPSTSKQGHQDIPDSGAISSNGSGRRVAILFDSTLAAYLMMGNLSPDLKSHAVTLFEVGKLCDESLDSLLMELDKVVADPEIEGEARRYLAAAACLRVALRSLRMRLRPLDLLRCEALHALGAAARTRLLSTKYRLAISTAPLSREARAGLAAGALPHVGPAPPEAHTPWMRLYLYHVAGYGPPTLLLTKGTHLRGVPRPLLGYSRLGVWWWGAEAALEGGGAAAGALPAAAALHAANTALRRGPVMLQALGVRHPAALKHLMFPPDADTCHDAQSLWSRHAGLRRLLKRLRLSRSAGYVTLADIGVPDLGCARPPATVQLVQSRKKKEICGMAKPISEISLSSTESAEKSTEEYSKSMTNRLQSPIESHFAVTPTVDSKTSSPANGFTSVECNQLLCEELDNMVINDQSHPDELANLIKDQSKSKESIACSDDLVPINSNSTSIEDLVKKHSKENSIISDDLVSIHSPVCDLKRDQVNQLSDLLSPAEESISMFTQLTDKLAEMSTAEGQDSGVDTAHNFSDEETCRPEKWTVLDLQFGIPLFDEILCEKICSCLVDRLVKPELLEKIKEDNDFICSDVLKFVSQCQYYPGEDMGIVKRGTLVPLPRKNLVFENGRITEWSGK